MHGQQGAGEARGAGRWGGRIYTAATVCKTDDSREHAVQHRELYSVDCGDLNEQEVQKRGVNVQA